MGIVLFLFIVFFLIFAASESLALAFLGLYVGYLIIKEAEGGVKKAKKEGAVTTQRGETVYRYFLQIILSVLACLTLLTCAPILGLGS